MESGQFETEDDVFREEIDALKRRQRGLQELRDMVRKADEQIAAGRVGPFDAEHTKSAVRRRLGAHGNRDRCLPLDVRKSQNATSRTSS